jgi:hypothetical protein
MVARVGGVTAVLECEQVTEGDGEWVGPACVSTQPPTTAPALLVSACT